MARQLTEQQILELEQLEAYRFWMLILAGAFTLGATLITAYISWKKPGV